EVWLRGVDEGRIGFPLPHPAGVSALAFSPDGQHVLTGDEDGAVRLWEAPRCKRLNRVPVDRGNILAVALSPDGKSGLAGTDDDVALLLDVETGKQLIRPLRHKDGVVAVAFSPDGKWLLTGSPDKTARVWDAATGAPRGPVLRHQGDVKRVAFSPDGKVILTESWVEKSGPPRLNSENDCGRSIRLWDAATGRPLGPPLLETVNPLYDVRFSPDGKCLWACFGENRSGVLQRWDVASGQRSGVPIEHSGQITVLDLSPDGKVLLTAWGKRDGPGKV